MRRALLWLAIGCVLPVVGCGGSGGTQAESAPRTLVGTWNQMTLDAITTTSPGPTVGARALGIVHTAIYDAWSAYDQVAVGTRLDDNLRQPVSAHTLRNKEVAISFAAYRVLVDLFPSEKARFDAQMARQGLNPALTSTDPTDPAGVGNAAAEALLEFRHRDGSNQLGDLAPGRYSDYTGYAPVNTATQVNDPSRWQPITFQSGATPGFLTPHWGRVVPFAMGSPSTFRPSAPPAFGSPAYLAQAEEVLRISADLDDRKKVIAEYWANGPNSVLPPGHWCRFAQWISARDGHTLDQDVKLFFLLGNAMLDSSIACWDAKVHYDTSRPFTAIRHLYKGKTIRSFDPVSMTFKDVDGSQWFPYQSGNFITPPFAEYTSGHSTFSAAGAEILRRFTGSDRFGYGVTLPAGWSDFERNIPAQPVSLQWETFSKAAEEAGHSRILGGIHFLGGDTEGRRCGQLVAAAVWERGMAFIEGRRSRP